MVGNLSSTDAMFRESGYKGTESHFGVGGIWGPDGPKGYDGKVFQWQDTTFTADANYQGNPRIISIETADNEPSTVAAIRPWTLKQINAIVDLVAWICKTHNIPAVQIPDSKPGRRGIGWHQLGCEHSLGVGKVPGFLIAGGERWSTKLGKECPGPQRIAQIKGIIIPNVAAILKPLPPKPVEVNSVTKELDEYRVLLTTKTQVDAMNSNDPKVPWKVGDSLDLRQIFLWGGPGQARVWKLLNAIDDKETANAVALHRIEAALAVLTAKIGTPTPTGDPRSV